MKKIYKNIYQLVAEIPRGKVATYGQIANKLKMKNVKCTITPRMVGRALHHNSEPKAIPCHRVVNSIGKIAQNFAFGGATEQKKRLVAEGVVFKNEQSVDLVKHIWNSP